MLFRGCIAAPHVAAVAIGLCAVALEAVPQSAGQTTGSTRTSSSELEMVQIRPNVHMIAGAGGNIAVQVGVDGVVLVDTVTRSNGSVPSAGKPPAARAEAVTTPALWESE